MDILDTQPLTAAVEHKSNRLFLKVGGKHDRRPGLNMDSSIWAPGLYTRALPQYVGDVPVEHAHNAGNDAMYTMTLLLSMLQHTAKEELLEEFDYPFWTGDDGGDGVTCGADAH